MKLDYPKQALNGETERSVKLKALENPKMSKRMRKKVLEELKEPEVPEEYISIWIVFWDLFSGGENGITYSDMWAYTQLHNITFTEEELAMLRVMNGAATSFISKTIRDEMKTKKG